MLNRVPLGIFYLSMILGILCKTRTSDHDSFQCLWKRVRIVLLRKINKICWWSLSYHHLCLINDLNTAIEYLLVQTLKNHMVVYGRIAYCLTNMVIEKGCLWTIWLFSWIRNFLQHSMMKNFWWQSAWT